MLANTVLPAMTSVGISDVSITIGSAGATTSRNGAGPGRSSHASW